MIKNFNIPENFLTIQEASILLNVDKKVIYDDIKFNKLHANIVNNRFYIKKETLDSYSLFLDRRRKVKNILWVTSGVLGIFLITALILVSVFCS